MCGIVGISATSNVNQLLFDALTVLQHRGQDAAGIATVDKLQFFMQKDNGLVRDVFRTRHIKNLLGNIGIGHVRYPTAGTSSSAEAQPFYVNSPYGIVLAHNGNLINADEIKENLYNSDFRHINTTSDSEILLNVFAHELSKVAQLNLHSNDVFTAVTQVYNRCLGGYAVVALINGHGLLAFRDPFGIRPLVFGKKQTNKGMEYMFASESVALSSLGFELIRDVSPGECIYVDSNQQVFSHQCVKGVKSPCLFEYIYLARPDSIVDGISVYQARLRMGQTLANKILRDWPDHDIDVVIPIPDTSRNLALEIAKRLGLPYREGLVKNRYIGRTFIMPGQAIREKNVRQKLNAIEEEFKDKNILLVDDSIVRGTTCQQIIEMTRESGARNVYFVSAAPVVRYPNVYGIDMPTEQELISYNRTEKEIEHYIGADRLIYQDLEDLLKTFIHLNSDIKQFDCSVFDGNYVVGNIDSNYLKLLEEKRYSQENKDVNGSVLDL